jgi:hypothetical protein
MKTLPTDNIVYVNPSQKIGFGGVVKGVVDPELKRLTDKNLLHETGATRVFITDRFGIGASETVHRYEDRKAMKHCIKRAKGRGCTVRTEPTVWII